jgi:hypothetical protein
VTVFGEMSDGLEVQAADCITIHQPHRRHPCRGRHDW